MLLTFLKVDLPSQMCPAWLWGTGFLPEVQKVNNPEEGVEGVDVSIEHRDVVVTLLVRA